MKKKVKAIPPGYHTVTPYLIVNDAGKLIEFLKKAFAAKVVDRLEGPGRRVAHAALKIGDSMIMMGEAHGEWKAMPAMIYLYVENVDALYRKALKAGAKSVREPADQFWGDRHGGVEDEFGNQWWVSTHIKDVSRAEIKKAAAAMAKEMEQKKSG